MTSAFVCLEHRWTPGTVLVNGDGEAILLTAVGESAILARLVAVRNGRGEWVRIPTGEGVWDLTAGTWVAAAGAEWARLLAMGR